jgi:hypothetical protein
MALDQEQVTLSSLLVPSKAIDIDYPGFEGFKVNIAFLSREELVKIRKKSTKTTFKNRQQTEELNEELFLKMYVEAIIKGWTGLKFKYLQDLLLVDISKRDPEDYLPFNLENALLLMKNSTEFDSFVSETVNDLSVFTKAS